MSISRYYIDFSFGKYRSVQKIMIQEGNTGIFQVSNTFLMISGSN